MRSALPVVVVCTFQVVGVSGWAFLNRRDKGRRSAMASSLQGLSTDGPMPVNCRPFCRETDESQLVQLVQELQQHELNLYDRMKPPSEIGTSYIDGLCHQCEEHDGHILVAVDSKTTTEILGYACVLTRVRSESKDEVSYMYGEVTDLAVVEHARGKGIGKGLLVSCEDLVRARGDVKYLRTSVLARNSGAVAAYRKYGFEDHLVEMEKHLE